MIIPIPALRSGRHLARCALELAVLFLAGVAPVHAVTPWIGDGMPLFRTVASATGDDGAVPDTPVPISLAQDSTGFIWIGTETGLERWDGYQMRSYSERPGDPCALPAAFVWSLHVSQDQRLWIGTFGHGIAYYDAHTDCIRPAPGGPAELKEATVEAIEDDGNGGLWIGTTTGLLRMAGDPATARRISADGSGRGRLTTERIAALRRDRQGNLWVGTDSGILRLRPGDTMFTEIALPARCRVRALLEAADGRIWAGTLDQGVFVVDPGTARVRSVANLTRQKRLPLILRIAESPKGDIWLGTEDAGIITVDPVSLQPRTTLHPLKDPANPNSDFEINAMYRDRDGLVWVATERGLGYFLSQADISTWPVADACRIFANNTVDGLAPAGDDDLAVSVAGKVALLGPQGPCRPIDGSALRMPPVAVTILAPVAGGGMFQAIQPGGLAWSDLSSRKTYPVYLPGPGISRRVLTIEPDEERTWVGGVEGLWLLERRKGAISPVPWVATRRIELHEVDAVVSARAGDTWFGTTHGLYRLQGRADAPVRVALAAASGPEAPDLEFTALCFDQHGRLWLGTNGRGVYVVDVPADVHAALPVVRHFASDLPRGLVSSILDDGRGGIWVGAQRALIHFDSTTLAMRILNPGDGAVNAVYSNGLAMRTGEVLFSGSRGVTVVRRDWHDPAGTATPVAITRILVGNRDIASAPANNPAAGGEFQLELPADHADVTIESAALDFSDPARNGYQHRLDGYDLDWVTAGLDARSASYMNLPPGEFRLHLRGANHAGIWSSNERQLLIHVPTPWFQTLWFHALEVAIAAAIFFATLQVRTAILRSRQRELESLVDKRTHALVQATDERNSLVESLAHDIRTPLTALRGYLETLNLRSTTLAEPERTRCIAIALRQADRLNRLVRELFDLARLDDARVPMALERIRLAELVQDVVQEFESLADGRIICFRADEPAKTSLITGDINLLQRLVDNLVYNAIVHTPQDGMITVTLGVEGELVILNVRDTGRGITPDDRERIFKRYERGSAADPAEGAGLGLAIAKMIVERHGGSIGVESELGHGTCFRVRLPMAGPAANAPGG